MLWRPLQDLVFLPNDPCTPSSEGREINLTLGDSQIQIKLACLKAPRHLRQRGRKGFHSGESKSHFLCSSTSVPYLSLRQGIQTNTVPRPSVFITLFQQRISADLDKECFDATADLQSAHTDGAQTEEDAITYRFIGSFGIFSSDLPSFPLPALRFLAFSILLISMINSLHGMN